MTVARSRRPTQRAKQALIAQSLPICWLCNGHINTTLPGNHPLGPSLHHHTPITHAPHLEWDPTNHRLTHLRCNQIAADRPPHQAQHHVRTTLGIPDTTHTRDWGIT